MGAALTAPLFLRGAFAVEPFGEKAKQLEKATLLIAERLNPALPHPLNYNLLLSEDPLMESDRVHIRRIDGRYPANAGPFDPENLEAICTREAQVVRVRIDDAQHPDAWLEILLEIED